MPEVFFSPLRDSASPLNSVAPNEKKASGTQGKFKPALPKTCMSDLNVHVNEINGV